MAVKQVLPRPAQLTIQKVISRGQKQMVLILIMAITLKAMKLLLVALLDKRKVLTPKDSRVLLKILLHTQKVTGLLQAVIALTLRALVQPLVLRHLTLKVMLLLLVGLIRTLKVAALLLGEHRLTQRVQEVLLPARRLTRKAQLQ